ncbi:MAG: head-tail connector protein, partial [Amoebophilaceae bacterium]|nr:head-tail connector protein [Amoebophilaceae bacterium]
MTETPKHDKDIALRILDRQKQMSSYRTNWESTWWAIDQKVLPSPNHWFGNKPQEGARVNQHIFDSTASLALGKFSAAMESMLTPRNTQWHKLNAGNLSANVEIQRYLDSVNDILFKARYSPAANFASQIAEVYLSLGKFGTGALFVYDELGKGIRYKSIHLSELFIIENAFGVVDTVHRKFQYTAHQAVEMFGIDKLPEKVIKSLDKGQRDKFTFIHCVEPNYEYDAYDQSLANFKWRSYYVLEDDNSLV